jgi:hypothetical protein
MILLRELVAWRRHAPWPKDFQIEQDLLLTRAMAAIFSDDFLSGQVAMRGGTVLHKIHLAPAARYSEDVDLVLVGDKTCGAPACIPDGEPCAFGDQCCGKICAPDPTTGALVCSPACIQPGQGCTTHADCCDGYCDPKTLTCGQPPSGCVPLGGSCKVNTDCCSGGCVGSVCIPAPR